MPPASASRAGVTPEASGDPSSRTLGKNMIRFVRVASYAIAACSITLLMFAWNPFLSRTPSGHFARLLLGSPLAQQWIDDLAWDLSRLDRDIVAKWVDEIRSDYTAGKIKSPGTSSRWNAGKVLLPKDRIPPWLPSGWSRSMFGQPPELALHLNSDGSPAFVVYAWYLKGVAFCGYRDVRIDIKSLGTGPVWGLRQSQFSMYAYAIEK
jgi:hypothetical protein